MNCNDVREHIFDLIEEGNAAPQDVRRHVAECAACAAEVNSLRKTMALLDEWSAPEPSPCFDVRLEARLREEKAAQQHGLLGSMKAVWLGLRWQPVMAASLSFAIAVGVIVYQTSHTSRESRPSAAVADLQALEKNADVYNNLDLVYDDDSQPQEQNP
jgi:hypothetical protein